MNLTNQYPSLELSCSKKKRLIYNRYISTFFLILSLLFQLLAAIASKEAALLIDPTRFCTTVINTYYVLSLLCLFFQAIVWPLALVNIPLYKAYSFMSLLYPGLLLVSKIFFHEQITLFNIVGSFIIMIGVYVLNAQKGAQLDV
jgi:drug/metabolite transporter (DMT)-like permease